jgi:CheY-like chemotaxis protein
MARILVVDDDQTTIHLLTLLLEMDGYEVQALSRGSDVLGRAQQYQPDLIMMDYHLSDMKSTAAIQQLRAHPELRDTPILIASGMNVEGEVLAAGANRFLNKPFDPSDLPAVFADLIGKGSHPQKAES